MSAYRKRPQLEAEITRMREMWKAARNAAADDLVRAASEAR